MSIVESIVPIVMIVGISAFSSFNFRSKEFDSGIFLVSMAIGIAVLIWMGVFPYYTLILSALILVALFFRNRGVSSE